MISLGLNFNKSFREQVEKCMFTTFGKITKPFIKATSAKHYTSVLAIIILYETIADKKSYRVLGFFIYTIMNIYVCIDYLAFQSKNLN